MPEHNFLKCECGTEVWLIYRAELDGGNVVRLVDIYRCLNCLTEHAGEEISLTPRVRKSFRSRWIADRLQRIPLRGTTVRDPKTQENPEEQSGKSSPPWDEKEYVIPETKRSRIRLGRSETR